VTVSPGFDAAAVAGTTDGAIDAFDYVDGVAGLVPHPRPSTVPRGAPLLLSGWAFDPHARTAARDVFLVLDGVQQLAVTVRYERADVAAAAPGERAGYRALVADDLPPGGHELRAYARDAAGRCYEAGYRPFWIYEPAQLGGTETARGEIRMRVEQIVEAGGPSAFMSSGAIGCGEPALVVGWAVDAAHSTGPAGVAVVDASGRVWSGAVRTPRPDLQAVLKTRDDRLGFEIVVPTDVLGRGLHALRVTPYDGAGRPYAATCTAELNIGGPLRRFPFTSRDDTGVPRAAAMLGRRDDENDDAPERALTAARPVAVERGTTISIEGWAIAPDGSAADDVFVEIAHEGGGPPHRHVALAGYRRVKSLRRAVLAAPPHDDAWFMCPFGTLELAPGRHAVTVAVAAHDRRTVSRALVGALDVVAARKDVANET
jgi:hypothetical protein